MVTLRHRYVDGARGSQGACPGLPDNARVPRLARSGGSSAPTLRDPHEPPALSGTSEERYRALGRQWDTARPAMCSALFPVQLTALSGSPKRARGAITDIKEASRLISGKAWLGSRRLEIAAAAKHSQNPLCLLQLSDRYRDAPRRRAYRDARHVSPWAENRLAKPKH